MKVKFQRRELYFILIACILVSSITLALMDLNSINPDETNYLFIGQTILEGKYGESDAYTSDFIHRPPMIPSLVSLSLLAGIGTNGARILIPMLFMNLLVIVTYIFAKTLYRRREAFITILFTLTFPFFWRWGFSILADIPVAVFSLLFLLFFYIGIESNKKYFLLSAIFLSLGMLLQQHILVFVIPVLLYLVIRGRFDVLKSGEFIISIILVPVIFFGIFLLFNVLTSATMELGQKTLIFTSAPWDVSELFKLVFAPSLIFSLIGLIAACVKRRRQDIFVTLAFLVYFLIFVYMGHLRLRYLMPLIPLMGVLAGIGFLKLREKINLKMVLDVILVVILAATFINSIYIIQLEESTLWGAEELSVYVNSFEGDVTFSSKYLPYYLKATTDKNIVLLKRYYEFNGEKLEEDEFFMVVTNLNHPKQAEYSGIFKSGNYTAFTNFDYEWLKENSVDYLVLSVYSDYERAGITEYYSPMFGPFEIGFIKRPYSNGRVPPAYEFSSDLYREIENDPRFTMLKEIYKGEQTIFIIYKLE